MNSESKRENHSIVNDSKESIFEQKPFQDFRSKFFKDIDKKENELKNLELKEAGVFRHKSEEILMKKINEKKEAKQSHKGQQIEKWVVGGKDKEEDVRKHKILIEKDLVLSSDSIRKV